ncbi:MAG: gamma-glutamylcyclotransferase family protein [Nitrospirales bacterium]
MSEGLLYYLAYGSNLHPVRLQERVPSAELLDVVELRSYRLAFQKRGQDGSSKCNLARTGEESDEVYGGIYQIDSAHKPVLDRFEGNGYHDSQLTVEFHGQEYSCLIYLAQPSYIEHSLKPFHWYKELIVLGARHLRFPDAYVRSIESIESVEDPDQESRMQHQKLIERILQYSQP